MGGMEGTRSLLGKWCSSVTCLSRMLGVDCD